MCVHVFLYLCVIEYACVCVSIALNYLMHYFILFQEPLLHTSLRPLYSIFFLFNLFFLPNIFPLSHADITRFESTLLQTVKDQNPTQLEAGNDNDFSSLSPNKESSQMKDFYDDDD